MNNATRFRYTVWLLAGLLAGNCPCIVAQAQEPVLTRLQQQVNTDRNQTVHEKLFVHTDRAFYMTGETVWFRLFYVDGSFHRPLDLSKVAYLELLDKDRKAVLQTKIPLSVGTGMGSLAIPVSLLSGQYIVRGYTHWMKSVSPDFLFEKTITIVNPFRRPGLPLATDSLAWDVQLFPEGGNLVTGLPARVAFKVVDLKSGRGVDCRGVLLTQTNDTVARFRPLKFGMGTFSFTPAKTSIYHVLLTDKSGRTLSRTLPAIDESGYTMQVDDLNAGQLLLTVRTNKPDGAVYLIGHTRQSVRVAERQPILGNQATFRIAKTSLGDGISHLTVFDAAARPVCERLYFKRPPPGLAIQIKPDKDQYTTRAPVTLTLATRAGGKPITADVSVAVYRLDSLQSVEPVTLPDYIWLTSDLRGTVESPGYYLTHTGPEADLAIDHLMLTHGWRRFRWESVLHPKPLDNEPIPEHGGITIQGRVLNTRTGLPVKDIVTFLSVPGNVVQLYSSRSDERGLVRFEMPGLSGTRDIVLQTAKSDSTYRVDIINPYAESAAVTQLPVFDLAETMQDALAIRSLAMQVQNNYYRQDAVRLQPSGTDSTAFYGVADERYELDAFTRFTVMEEVLREYVPGVTVRRRNKQFGLRVTNSPYKEVFSEDALILLDGVPVFNTDQLMALTPLKIKTLEVVTRRYLLGYASIPGIISFKTYKGDLAGFQLDPRAVLVEYDGLQARREFYAPRYETQPQLENRLPDFRNLLYWNPQLTANAQDGNRPTFYTSDQEGSYLIVVQGMTADGQFGSTQQQIIVRPVLK